MKKAFQFIFYLSLLMNLSFLFGLNKSNDKNNNNSERILKRIVLLLPFNNKNDVSKYDYLSTTLPEALKGELIKTSLFLFPDESKVETLIKQRSIEKTDFSDQDIALSAAHKVKADVVIVGQYIIIENKIMILIKVIDILSNKTVVNFKLSGSLGLDIFRLIDDSTAEVVKEMKNNIKPVKKSYFDKMKRKNKMEYLKKIITFRTILEFWYQPLLYESTYYLFGATFNGLFYAGIKIEKLNIGFKIINSYISVSGQDPYKNLTGALNILQFATSLSYRPFSFFEAEFGLGGSWLSTSFNYNNLILLNIHYGGLLLLTNFTFQPPWKYIVIKQINRLNLFFSSNMTLPYYYGAIRTEFHPYLMWITLFLELGVMPWYYTNPYVSVLTGIFMWSIGLSFDLEFPKVISYMKNLKNKNKLKTGENN